MKDHNRSFWEVVEGIVSVSGDGGGCVGAGSSGPRPAARFGNATGLSSVHIPPRVEPEHPSDVLARWGNEPLSSIRRCRDFAADKFLIADGANFVRLKGRRYNCPPGHLGVRGDIVGFSHMSRRRLLELVNSIDRSKIDVKRMWFVTLTYPGQWPADPRRWKRDLDTLGKRIRRAWGPLPAIWKLEAQKRGAPHFHLIVLVSPEKAYDGLNECRNWLSQAWYEIVGSGDERHLRAGTQIEPIRTWQGVCSYAAKYLGKITDFIHESLVTPDGEPISIGRFWGVWNKPLWPITINEMFVPDQVANRVRRSIRKYIEKQGGQHRRLNKRCAFTAFVPSAVVWKALWHEIIEIYGYDRYIGWKKRRGQPEPPNPHQDYQDFLSCCAEEYSKMRNNSSFN